MPSMSKGGLYPLALSVCSLENDAISAAIRHNDDMKRRTVALDDPDKRLLALLREDARLSTAELARRLGLARTTVVERVNRLANRGVISGFTVRMNPRYEARLLRVHVLLDVDPKKGESVVAALKAMPQVKAVHAISGAFDSLAFVEGETTEEIDGVLDAIGQVPGVGKTQSSLVLSVKFDRQ